MSVEPSAPPPSPPPASGNRGLMLAGAVVVLLVLILATQLPNWLRPNGAAATPTAPAPASPTAPEATPSEMALAGATASAPAIASGPVATTGAAQLPTPGGTAAAGTPISGSVALSPEATGTAGGAPAPAGASVVDVSGAAYVCGRTQGCADPAAPGLSVYPGGEARTGPDGRLRLQTPAGLLALGSGGVVQVASLDERQVTIALTGGQLLARAAPGRQIPLVVRAGPAVVTGAGTTFGVALDPSGGARVTAPADAPRPVQVQGAGAGAAVSLAPGSTLTVTVAGGVGAPGPISDADSAALAALGDLAPAGTPVAAAFVTVLPLPSVGPFPPGVVTATIVLTPPPEQTLPPLTVRPITEGTATPGTPIPPASPTAVIAGKPGAGGFSAAFAAMSAIGSYTFGATRGADPAGAEFSAGTYTGDTACWITTAGGQRTDFQARGGSLFRRAGSGAWSQDPTTPAIPAWMTAWKYLGQIDPATALDFGTAPLDAAPVSRLRARLAADAGLGADVWVEAFVGVDDHLARSVAVYQGAPEAGSPLLKIGFSSLGAALSCPPLTAP
jgi:hypothetical protein